MEEEIRNEMDLNEENRIDSNEESEKKKSGSGVIVVGIAAAVAAAVAFTIKRRRDKKKIVAPLEANEPEEEDLFEEDSTEPEEI